MRFILILATALLYACNSEEEVSGVLSYYPPQDLLEEGVVNKYYVHYYPANPDAKSRTNISYYLMKKSGEDRLSLELYNAGFQLTSTLLFRIGEEKIWLEDHQRIFRADTSAAKITASLYESWYGKQDSAFVEIFEFDDRRYQYAAKQLSVEETTIDELPARLFTKELEITHLNEGEVVHSETESISYVKGFGFYGANIEINSGREVYELVEQMPLKKFEKLKDHGRHRVGYIDPSRTLGESEGFELCNHELKVANYYNPESGGHAEGKNVLEETIRSQLDEAILDDQSGILIFRFAVNCEGEAGWFKAEGYDLAYNEKAFDQRTVDHFFEILSKLKNWKPVNIEGEKRDAYFYLNFRITDGKLIEILP